MVMVSRSVSFAVGAALITGCSAGHMAQKTTAQPSASSPTTSSQTSVETTWNFPRQCGQMSVHALLSGHSQILHPGDATLTLASGEVLNIAVSGACGVQTSIEADSPAVLRPTSRGFTAMRPGHSIVQLTIASCVLESCAGGMAFVGVVRVSVT